MNINQNYLNQHPEILELISIKKITLLNEIDNKIKIIKTGEFKYYKNFCFELDNIWNFIHNLDKDRIYILIPFISVNNKPNEPYTILSKQILFTRQSNVNLLHYYISEKINIVYNQFGIVGLKEFFIIFKYKSIEIDFKSYNKFI